MDRVVMIFKELPTLDSDCCPGVGQKVGQAKCKITHVITCLVPRPAELRNTAPCKTMTHFLPQIVKELLASWIGWFLHYPLSTIHSQLLNHSVPYAVQSFICEK